MYARFKVVHNFFLGDVLLPHPLNFNGDMQIDANG